MIAAVFKGQIRIEAQRVKSLGMKFIHLLFNILDGNAADTAYGIGKVFFNHLGVDTDGFKNLGALIGLYR